MAVAAKVASKAPARISPWVLWPLSAWMLMYAALPILGSLAPKAEQEAQVEMMRKLPWMASIREPVRPPLPLPRARWADVGRNPRTAISNSYGDCETLRSCTEGTSSPRELLSASLWSASLTSRAGSSGRLGSRSNTSL